MVENFTSLLKLYGRKSTNKSLSLQNLDQIQKESEVRIRLFQYDDDEILFPYYAPVGQNKNFPEMNILILKEPEFREEIVNFKFICDPKTIPKIYVCTKMMKCNYSTSKYANFARHIESCPESSTQKIRTKQISYGTHPGPLEQLLESGYLPKEAKNFRKKIFISFDIEAYEEKTGIMRKQTLEVAQHKILSIAVGTNNGFQWAQHRKDSTPNGAQNLVDAFLDQLQNLEIDYSTQFPDYFYDALETIEGDLKSETINRPQKQYLNMLKRYLEKYLKMDLYSFNGGRYDLNVLAPYLLPGLASRYDNINLLKKNSSYFSIETEKLCFKDALYFTTPQNLSSYLKQNSVVEEKSIFPYSKFGSIEEMLETTEFPSFDSFYSELNKTNVSQEAYKNAQCEFKRRQLLPPNDPDHMKNFADWLLYYNLLDVTPLSKAIDNSFQNFFTIFGCDPSWCLSLPKFSQEC